MERVKSVLHRYFDAGTIRFKEPDILFDLLPKIMFRDAFLKLSWFRRMMLKMMGRYDSFVQAMDSPAGSSSSGEYGVPRRSGSGSGNGTVAMLGGPDDVLEISDFASNSGSSGSSSGRRPGSRTGRQTGGTPSGSRRKKTPPPAAKQKRYSMQQQQEAWDDFRSAYKKKKGD